MAYAEVVWCFTEVVYTFTIEGTPLHMGKTDRAIADPALQNSQISLYYRQQNNNKG